MRTTFDVETILYQLLDGNSAVKSVFGERIFKSKRPLNSKSLDLVVGSFPINNNQVQTTVGSVNIYVPNQKIDVDENQDDTMPDNGKLKEYTDLVSDILKEKIGSDYWFDIQQQNVFDDTENSKCHYSNIRLNFYSLNLN